MTCDCIAQLTDWTAHIPKDVLAKNFGVNMTAFDNIPASELYIFPGTAPSPTAVAVEDPAGQVPQPYAYEFSKVAPVPLSGGTMKVADASVFPIAQQISVAELSIEPGAIRELHVRTHC